MDTEHLGTTEIRHIKMLTQVLLGLLLGLLKLLVLDELFPLLQMTVIPGSVFEILWMTQWNFMLELMPRELESSEPTPGVKVVIYAL